MSSIIEGYNYDIFISYRQKDNKGEKWVSEFVDALKVELESTFKEEINLYFDINPHDGLLETHDVGASLKEKLKCLVFIPVISRTYCDTKSFAWEHEFKAFIEQASKDQLGLKVILPNGNVASRVLPVRIHDLDTADVRLCEGIMEGVLRSVDFIYKSAGVNRPLRANEDHPHDNLLKIYYRDQINKVANAAEEIISSLKRTQSSPYKENWSFKVSENQNNIFFPVNYESQKIAGIQIQSQKKGTIQKKSFTTISKSWGDWHNNFTRYVISILFIAVIVVSGLSLKGKFKFFGISNSKREVARSHVANAVKYFNESFYAPAKSELELALKIDPKYSTAWSTLAAVSVRLGNLDEAVMQTIEAIKFDPKNDTAAYNLAYALDDKKDYHQAVIWYSRAIEIDSTLVPAYSALGNLYNRLKQPVDAVLILSLAKDKYPESEYMYLIYRNLGNSHFLMDQFDEAIKWLEQSIKIKPSEAETNQYLAKAYEAAGKMNRSIDAWQNYIDLETDTARANSAKKHLKEITIKHLQEISK
jgi:tetratricopeptide (TPR) repeat protein